MSQEMSEKAPELPPRSAQRNSQATSEHATPSPPLQPSHTQTSHPSQHPAQQPVQQPAQAREAQQQPAFPAFIPAPAAQQPEPNTFRERLNAGDAHWQWKLALRAILIIVGIIGIGCAAWTVATFTNRGPYEYELDDGWSMPWTLITFSISVLWSAVCILVFFLRRPNAPVHPGCQVGIDLILWLAFIPTALFAVVAVMSVMNFGSDGLIGEYSSYGYYHYVPSNNTWVWNATSYDSYYGNSRDCNSSSSSSSSFYSSGYGFANCADEDAYVNNLWKEKNHRFNTELTATVCQFIALLLHFALFVWACIDTHHRNSRKTSKDAEQLAADIVMNMVRSGAIIPPPGQAHMRPMGGPQMMPPHMMQAYPQQYFQQFHPQGPVAPPQPAVASSSNEKGVGPRYA